MPEIQHTFTSGKMNKDLDERLVPNGEYRDALNIEVAGSSGDDVGAAQNILGNKLAYSAAIGISGSKCIGGIADTENEKIYWFITGTSVDAIAEYDQLTGDVVPVLVDTGSVLNFSKDNAYKITGVNFIDGLIFWTDNNSEPKVINIEKCKAGSTNWSTHTVLKQQNDSTYNFAEDDITVIKKGPSVQPTITMANTKRQTLGGTTGVVASTVSYNFSSGDVLFEVGKNNISLSFSNHPTFQSGDTLILSAGDDANGFDDEYAIRLKINTGYNYPATTFVCTILSISENTPTESTDWEVTLKQDDALFEKEFVRFAYRYKYQDGEYSCFSPFSDVAFLPQPFEYEPAKGFNLGMVNDIRFLKITNFVPSDLPKQVKEIDILFKKENNANIYVVKSIKYEDVEWTGTGTYELESEMIYKTVETNQLLRPWDNVPLKAQAQELVANRIVYGNYTQQFNLTDSNGTEISPKFDIQPNVRSEPTIGTAGKSVKTQRTYQLGVVYRDAYGRETPVQSDDSASFSLAKDDSVNYNNIHANITSNPPLFASSYKFFIKETSNEYYNLCMDRWYDAEDGNVWLSFPSAERNKVDEETFLILKKEHDNNVFVQAQAKYKVIAIENSAPTEMKETKTSFGIIVTGFASDAYPLPDGTYVDVDKDDFEDRWGENSIITSSSGLCIRIIASAGKSDWYDVSSIGLNTNTSGDGDDEYRFNLKKKFLSDVKQFFPTGAFASAVGGLSLEIAKTEVKNKAEFTGRFFVKVYRDQVLEDHILTSVSEDSFSIKHQTGIYKRTGGCGRHSMGDYLELGPNYRWHINNCTFDRFSGDEAFGTDPSLVSGSLSSFKYGIKSGKTKIVIMFHSKNKLTNVMSCDGGAHSNMATALTTDGTQFRFTEDPDETIYTIEKHAWKGVKYFSKKDWPRNKGTIFVLKLDKPIGAYDFTSDVANSTFGNIEILQTYNQDSTYKSQNPAIWETEPKEAIDVDLYYEASQAYAIGTHGTAQILDWFNCYAWGNGVESNRIRDDYNAMTITKGVKASATLAEQYNQEVRKNGLIYSGLYNSTSGINRLNQFIQAEAITKDLNPEYGSIQKIHQRDTDLTICCEDKVLKVLANKDALYEASGNPQLTSTNAVLGQSVPYIGEYGISKNAESFASYGFRSYFTDKARGVVLRLSRNGLSEISGHGMTDYFRDKLANIDFAVGSFDDNKNLYNLTLTNNEVRGNDDTISFQEKITGWPSRKSFLPEFALSLNNVYYSWRLGEMYSHNNATRNNFYGTQNNSSIKLMLNDNPSLIKSFKTISYEGSKSRILEDTRKVGLDSGGNIITSTPFDSIGDRAGDTTGSLYNQNAITGWYVSSITTDKQEGFIPEFIEKEGKWFNYIKGNATTLANLDSREFNIQGLGVPSSVTDTSAPTTSIITVTENAD